MKTPWVSIVVPVYNTEKYLCRCLDSILAQTFHNFELILVDDCSTDNSCKIVNGYMSEFNGRLKLYHTEKNSGSGAVARNIGLSRASGEYVFNMDNDDMLTKTALEEMYTLAKEYDADVVYCEKYYESDDDGKNIRTQIWQKGDLVDKPTFESEDLKERVKAIIDDRYWVVPWSKMIRRKLLVDNKILFPTLNISDDNIWNHALVFCAEKFLRVPNAVYIYRLSNKSIMRIKKPPKVRMNFWLRPILLGLKILDELMSKHEFFKVNPEYRYAILEKFINVRVDWIYSSSKKLSKDVIYNTIKKEFGKYFGEYDVLISCLCTQLFEKDIALKENDLLLNRGKRKRAFTAISVVIPLYNAEEYVGECLESLLIQTFQDFEVIVVDDCSTDNSVRIVKNYAPKFDGRLKLLKTKKNSGTGGYVPRNFGFSFARGEYVFFIDADDFILGSALETLYKAAKKYNADLVYTSAYYHMNKPNDIFVNRDGKGKELIRQDIEEKPSMTLNNPQKLLDLIIFEKGFTTPWTHFVRRDFLLENKIAFPEIPKAGDYIWAIHSCCYAKRYLRLSAPIYFYRTYNVNSVSQSKEQNRFFNYVLSFAAFAKTLSDLSDEIDILRNNPVYCYRASKRYFEWCLNRTREARKALDSQEVYKILYNEFSKSKDLLKSMTPFLFAIIDDNKKGKNI